MKQSRSVVLLVALTLFSSACTTTGHFIAPAGSELVIRGRHVVVPPNGKVTTLVLADGFQSRITYDLVHDTQK